MVWIITLLIFAGIGLGMLLLVRLVITHVKESEKLRNSEDFFAKFSYTDEEWDRLYQNEFVDDDRVKSVFGEYADVIAIGEYGSNDAEKEIHFSDRGIYISGNGQRKSFAVNRLNLNGDGIHLLSIRLIAPTNKLRVNVKIDIDLADYRVNRDLDYIIPIPVSAMADIDEILNRYAS